MATDADTLNLVPDQWPADPDWLSAAEAAPTRSATPSCTFAEMMPLFQELFDPDPSRYIALMGRFKFLLKNGAAKGVQKGRGRVAGYTAEDVWRLTVMMELTEIGLPPAKAVQFYDEHFFDGEVEGPKEASRSGSLIQVNVATLEAAMARHLPRLFDR